MLGFAPSGVQEAYDLTVLSFGLADKYRIPAIILGDGMLGQMMEPLVTNGKNYKPLAISHKPKEWAATGCKGRKPNVVKSFYLNLGELEQFNLKLQEKYQDIRPQGTKI